LLSDDLSEERRGKRSKTLLHDGGVVGSNNLRKKDEILPEEYN
jgi:hypothetical protein